VDEGQAAGVADRLVRDAGQLAYRAIARGQRIEPERVRVLAVEPI
jgi:hypothetical protein